MRFSTILPFVAAIAITAAQNNTVTGQLGDAQVVSNNPIGASYVAELPDHPANGNTVRGSLVAQSAPDGSGVLFQLSVSNMPSEGGPFLYHIHAFPVPTDGNCTGTEAHLDPYIRGEMPVCNADEPQTCQVGDLSGKHGMINQTDFSASFADPYASLTEGIGAFFGNRSVTFHYANTTRITCANFSMISAGSPDGMIGGGSSAGVGTATETATVILPSTTGATLATLSAAGATSSAAVGGAATTSSRKTAGATASKSRAATTSSGAAQSTSNAGAALEFSGFAGAAAVAALGAALL